MCFLNFRLWLQNDVYVETSHHELKQLLFYNALLEHIEGPWGVDAKVHIFAATALERGSVVSPTLNCLHPQECPGIHFTGNQAGVDVFF